MGSHKVDRQRSHPAFDNGLAAVPLHVRDGELHQRRRALEVITGEELRYRLLPVALLLIPFPAAPT